MTPFGRQLYEFHAGTARTMLPRRLNSAASVVVEGCERVFVRAPQHMPSSVRRTSDVEPGKLPEWYKFPELSTIQPRAYLVGASAGVNAGEGVVIMRIESGCRMLGIVSEPPT